ncbi:hypothetical protein JCM8115_004315 [Rhodotorula mucilaginosa]
MHSTFSSTSSRDPLLPFINTAATPSSSSSSSSSPSRSSDEAHSPIHDNAGSYSKEGKGWRDSSPTTSGAPTRAGWKSFSGSSRKSLYSSTTPLRPFGNPSRRSVVLFLVLVAAASGLFFASRTPGLGASSSSSSSSGSSSSFARRPPPPKSPSSSKWRSPFSFSLAPLLGTNAPNQLASCTPHAPADLAERFDRASRPLEVTATTGERLDDWEFEAPGWGVEPADWVRRNVQSCPSHRIKPNQNSQQLDNSHLIWTALNTTGIMQLRQEMITFLRRMEKEGKMGPKAWGEGKGLVFTAGNADTFSRVLVTLKVLRNRLYTTLPAEIFSYPGEEPSDEVRKELERYGAVLRTVEEAQRDTKRTKNYQIKATAIVRSSFREVMFLDSDNVPAASLMPRDAPPPQEILDRAIRENRTETPWDSVRSDGAREEIRGKPSGIWEGKAYQRLGAMMWPDYWRTQPDNPIWAIIGVPCRDEWEMEAGQILIDKARHLDALLLAEWMMDRERFSYWFNFSDGDKDMFRFAFLALRKRWAVPGRYVSVGALPRDTMSGFCGLTMLQNDHLGRPMFVHYNLLKQVTSGVGRGFAWGRHRQVRTPPSTLTLQGPIGSAGNSRELEEKLDPLRDDDVDCDMLANAGNDGYSIERVGRDERGWRTRRRAVWEKGIRAGFHGGWISALCIDYHWDDPRSEEEKSDSRRSVALGLPNPEHKSLDELADGVDISYTSAPDGFEVKFDANEVLEVVQWADDPRLRDFEAAFFDEGGVVNGQGF